MHIGLYNLCLDYLQTHKYTSHLVAWWFLFFVYVVLMIKFEFHETFESDLNGVAIMTSSLYHLNIRLNVK